MWLAGGLYLEVTTIKLKDMVFWRQLRGPVWCFSEVSLWLQLGWFPRG